VWLILRCIAGDCLSQELHSALKNVQGELAQHSHVNSMYLPDLAV
jgi:hypothetical protein